MIEIKDMNIDEEKTREQMSYWNEATFNINNGKKLSELNKQEYAMILDWIGIWLKTETNVIGPFACNDSEGIKDTIEQLGLKTNTNVSEHEEYEQLVKHAKIINKAIKDKTNVNIEEMISGKL